MVDYDLRRMQVVTLSAALGDRVGDKVLGRLRRPGISLALNSSY